MGFHRTFGFEFQSNGQHPIENNFKQTTNCPATRAKKRLSILCFCLIF